MNIIIIRDKDADGEILMGIKTITTTKEEIMEIINEVWSIDGYNIDDIIDRLPNDCFIIKPEEVWF